MTITKTTEITFSRINDADMNKYREVRDVLTSVGYTEEEGEYFISFTLKTDVQCEVKE